MRKVFSLLAAAFFTVSLHTPVQAEIKLPDDIVENVTVGINGVYNLDFDKANENIQQVFTIKTTIKNAWKVLLQFKLTNLLRK